MVEIKAIIIDFPDGKRRLTVFLWQIGDRAGQFLVYPSDLPENKGQIKKYVAEKLGIPMSEILWVEGVEVPKT